MSLWLLWLVGVPRAQILDLSIGTEQIALSVFDRAVWDAVLDPEDDVLPGAGDSLESGRWTTQIDLVLAPGGIPVQITSASIPEEATTSADPLQAKRQAWLDHAILRAFRSTPVFPSAPHFLVGEDGLATRRLTFVLVVEGGSQGDCVWRPHIPVF